MKIFVPSDVRFETRAGNYIHYRIALCLSRLGHTVYYSSPPYEWKRQPEVDLLSLTYVPPDDWAEVLKECDLLIWVGNPYGWWGDLNKFLPLLVQTEHPSVCYLCLDYWEGWLLGNEWWKVTEAEQKLISRSEYIFAVSPQLCSYLSSRYKRKVLWLPNASVSFATFAEESPKDKLVLIISSFCPIRRCVQDVIKLAFLHLDWKFVWIGGGYSHHKPTSQPFKYPPNLLLLGERGNEEVIKWSRRALLGIVPAGRNWFSYFADPTKWYVYHMLQLPIVSVHTPHHQRYPSFYPSTVTGWDLVETFRRALNNLPEPTKPQEFHTWEHRTEAFLKGIEEGEAVYGYAEGGKFHYTFI